MSNDRSIARPSKTAIYGWLAVAAVVLAAFGASALLHHHSGGPKPTDQQVLKVGNQLGSTHAVMEAAGVLKDTPYRIEWSLFPAASPLLEALGAGAIDVGGMGDAPFAFAYSGGARIKAVQAYRYIGNEKASAIVVPANSPLKTIYDLKGRKIATVHGSAGQDLVLRLLERASMKPTDVTFVFLDNGSAKAALSTGAIDAWSTWSSYVGIALLHDGDRSIADATGLKKGVGFQAATETAIANKRAILHDFLHRLTLAYSWAATHRDAYAAVLAKETKLPLDVAKFTTRAIYQPVPIGPELAADERATFERYKRAGVIDKVPDLTNAYDVSFNDTDRP